MAELDGKNNVFELETPYGNTGCVDTEANGLIACVDWVQVTLKSLQNLQEACDLLRLPISSFEIRKSGFLGYNQSAKFGNIIIGWEPLSPIQNGRGVHISMSGQACREYEKYFDLEMNWSEFFALVMNFEHNFTRLDIAIDDFKGYFSIAQLYRTAKAGCMTAQRVKKARNFETFNIDDGKTDGQTLYVGKSDWMFRFYDKKAERSNAGYDLEDYLKCWNRYEIQLRGKLATEAAHVLAFEQYSLGAFAKGFFSAKIDFKIKSKTDSNKSRWESKKWWLDFLGDCEKVHLSQVAPDPTIPKIKNWIGTQVDASFATLVKAFGNDSLIYDYFYYKGREKLGRRHENILEEFEKYPELKQEIWDEMVTYIQDVRENDFQEYVNDLTKKIEKENIRLLNEKKELTKDRKS